MVFVHAFAGATIAHLSIRNKGLSDKQKSIIYALGVIGSIFPDFDFIIIFLKVAEAHRFFLTHSAVPYTVAFIIWLIATNGKDTFRLYGTVFYLAALSHLGLDMLTGGLVFLAPFTYKIYGIPLPYFGSREEWARMYLFSPLYMVGEVLVAGLYLRLIRKEPNRIAKSLPWLFLLLASLMVLLLMLF